MLVVGLTGGIGSGKSSVSDLFEDLGVPVIDADIVAREVVEPGEQALREIIGQFGEGVLTPDGRLDRRQLRERVFQDEAARKALEGILHPRIRQRMRERLTRLDAPYAIFSVPLLVETGQHLAVDRVLVVDCPPEEQIRRIRARDNSSAEQARAILAAQIPRNQRLRLADDVIDNSGAIEALERQVRALHQKYLDLAILFTQAR